jgi:hypothetical protein
LKEHDFGGLCQLGLLSGQDQVEGIEQGREKNCYRAMHGLLGILHKLKLTAHDERNAHHACQRCPDGRAPYALAQENGRKKECEQGCYKTQADSIGEREPGKAPEERQQYNRNYGGPQNMKLEHGTLWPSPSSRKPNGT